MKKGNLLIIDDQELITDRISILLADYTDKVFTATDGKIGIEILNKNQIHCVICDINMPDMTGVDILKKIRADNNNVPFIFYTAFGTKELMEEVLKYGAFDFLEKPNLDGLLEIVTKGLENGFSQEKYQDNDPDSLISEYRKMLKQSSKNNP